MAINSVFYQQTKTWSQERLPLIKIEGQTMRKVNELKTKTREALINYHLSMPSDPLQQVRIIRKELKSG